jgi:hypothetical protein
MYGVYRPFFTEQVPTQVGPNGIGFMGQPDGSLYPVGGPFSKYSSFGRRRAGFGNKLTEQELETLAKLRKLRFKKGNLYNREELDPANMAWYLQTNATRKNVPLLTHHFGKKKN